MKQSILVLGDDPRQLHLKKLFHSQNDEYPLSPQEFSFRDDYQIIILPVPTTEELLTETDRLGKPGVCVFGGGISDTWKSRFEEKQIHYHNYMANESSAILNAVATAEGIVAEAIISSDRTIQDSSCLITGFGRCGEILGMKLKALNAQVYVKTRNPAAQAKACALGLRTQEPDYPGLDFIFNTAPGPVIGKDIIDQLSQSAMIFDLATAPGGTDFKYCAEKGIFARIYPGLPAKYAPHSSAGIVYQEIKNELLKMGVAYES